MRPLLVAVIVVTVSVTGFFLWDGTVSPTPLFLDYVVAY